MFGGDSCHLERLGASALRHQCLSSLLLSEAAVYETRRRLTTDTTGTVVTTTNTECFPEGFLPRIPCGKTSRGIFVSNLRSTARPIVRVRSHPMWVFLDPRHLEGTFRHFGKRRASEKRDQIPHPELRIRYHLAKLPDPGQFQGMEHTSISSEL